MLYRSMEADADGLPVLGRSARRLGVRIGSTDDDIPVINDRVHALNGGMSVAIDDPTALPHWRRPAAFQGTGRGLVMFGLELDTLLDTPLALRVDRKNSSHGFIEPVRSLPIDEYEQYLGETRGHWRAILKP